MRREQYNESLDDEENQSYSNHIHDFLDVSLEMPIKTGDIHITNHNINHMDSEKHMKRPGKIHIKIGCAIICILYPNATINN